MPDAVGARRPVSGHPGPGAPLPRLVVMSTGPVPQRLSDADRDAAVEMLRQHFTDGRLDETEFSDRMGAALVARYADDVAPLFDDLPAPRPDWLGAPASEPPAWTPASAAASGLPVPWTARPGGVQPVADQRSRAIAMARALIWPIAILMLVLGAPGGAGWIFVAIVGSIILKQLAGPGRTPPPPLGR